uniref:Uncharacterized protein n=1 Tax=Buteo japonicus TaxID=224669 RepID=A0A8B9Z532_9AVES
MPSPTLAPRTLFHSDSVEGSRGEKLMHDAIREGTVAPGWRCSRWGTGLGWGPPSRGCAWLGVPRDRNGDAGSFNGSLEFCRADSDAGQRVSAVGGDTGGTPPPCARATVVSLFSLCRMGMATSSCRRYPRRLVAPCCREEEDGDSRGQAGILPARTSLPASPLLTSPSLHSPAYVPLPASPSLHSPAYI